MEESKYETVNKYFEQIQMSATKQDESIEKLQADAAGLEKEIADLEAKCKAERNFERLIDEDRNLMMIKKDTQLTTQGQIMEADTLKDENIAHLKDILKTIEEQQKVRRTEYEGLFQTLGERVRNKPKSYELKALKTNIERINNEYVCIQNDLKQVEEELALMKNDFWKVGAKEKTSIDVLTKVMYGKDKKKIDKENQQIRTVIADIEKLSHESEQLDFEIRNMKPNLQK